MSNNLLVCKSNWKAESGSLDNIYYIKPTETSDEEDKRIASDNTPLTLVKGDCTCSCEVIINFSQATTLKYVHIISGARNVELYVKQTNLAQTNYVTTIRGNRLDPENNDVNRVFVSDFVNKTNPRIKYDVVKLKLLSLVDKTKCIVNGIFIGVYENPSINSPLIGTNPSETQRTSFIQQQQQQQYHHQPQQNQPPTQNYNLINTYQMQFMLSSEVKKMEARLITRLDRTCLSIMENFNKKISSMEERLGLMEDAIEVIVNRMIPESDKTTEVNQSEQQKENDEGKEEQQQQEGKHDDDEEEQQQLQPEEHIQEEEQHQQNESQNELESNDENVISNSLEESESQNEQQVDNNNVEQITTESEPHTEIKKVEELEDHKQQTTETEFSECD